MTGACPPKAHPDTLWLRAAHFGGHNLHVAFEP